MHRFWWKCLKTAETSSQFYNLFKIDQLMSNRPSHDRYLPDFEHAVWQYALCKTPHNPIDTFIWENPIKMLGGFCGVLHNVSSPSIVLICLDVTSSFPERLVSTSDTSETNFRLFLMATKPGTEDKMKDEEKRRRWRTPSTVFAVLFLWTFFWPCSTFYRSYFCCLRHVLGKERLLYIYRYKN